jgi:hypothetical protein
VVQQVAVDDAVFVGVPLDRLPGNVPVLAHLAVLEPLVPAGGPVDLLGDAVSDAHTP